MNRRKVTLWVLGTVSGVFLVLCILTIFMLRQLQPPSPTINYQLPPPLISISFVGYSNAADGRLLAQFAVSNLTDSRVMVQRPVPITCANGQWSMMSATGQPFYLQGGERKVLSVPKPMQVEAWRLPVFHGAIPSRLALNGLRVWRALPWKQAQLDERIEAAGGIHIRLAESEIRSD